MPTLHIHLLGDLRLVYGDAPVTTVNSPRLQSLLAYLVLHRDAPQPRYHLAFLLWPDSTEAQARTNLRNLLHLLRRALPDADRFLRADARTLQWRSGATFALDVARFESAVVRADQAEAAGAQTAVRVALEQAVALYRGDLLPSCYDDWILPERERLRQTFVDALERLILLLEGQRDYRTAIGYAQRLLRHDPLHEATYRRLMRLHALSGDRAGALRAYHTCATVLQRELDAEPSPATREAHERLLKVDAPPAPPPLIAVSPLVGRDQEWAGLQAAWRRAATGHPGFVLLTGEAGIGKTRLAEELIEWADRQGIPTASARGYAAEGGLAYAPVAAWLRARPLPPLDDVWLTEVARLLPELLVERSDLPHPGPLTETWQRQHLFEALARAVLEGNQPLLLLIDDLQWCDRETLRWLHYLLRFDPQARLLIVGTLRPEETGADHPLASLLSALRRSGGLTEIELGPLDEAETASLGAHVAGRKLDPAMATHLYQETEGNPLFVVETVRAAAGDWSMVPDTRSLISSLRSLPPKVQAVITARLAQLSSPARELVNVAATIGREFTFDVLARASDSDEDTLVRGLDELWQRRIVREQGADAYDFSHDKIREVIYEGLSPPRRIHLHRKVATALEELHEERTEEIAVQLARHYAEAGEGEKAVEYLLQAGDWARGLYAYQGAIEHYQRALAFLKEQGAHQRAARTLMKLGLTYHSAFDFRRARQAYEEGFTLWQRAGGMQPAVPPPPAPHALRVDWGDPMTLDPTMAGDVGSAGLIDQLFSGLVERSPEMDVVPAVARTWEVSEGGRKYVFHLREDVRWSDGASVTAEDFEYAWKRALDPATGSPSASLLYDVKGARSFHRGEVPDPDRVGVRALDEMTLVVELEGPTGYFPHLLTCCATYPVPRHVVEPHGEAWTEMGNIVTNGPFRLEAWQRGKPVILARNREYYGPFTGNVQRVELSLPADRAARLALYEADDLDVLGLWEFPPLEWDYARQRYAGEYVSVPRLHTYYVGFDVSRPPFDDPRVRRAFVLAIDRETLADVVMMGYVSPATGGLLPPGMPGHAAGIGLPYDPDRAGQLLAEAGYAGGFGFPAVELLTFRRADPESEYMLSQWRENLGVEITWKTLEVEIFFDRVEKEPPHMFLSGNYADYPDPDDFLRVSPHVRRTRWRNEIYAALVEGARRVTDQEERMRMYQQADRILVEEAAIMPLVYGRLHLLVKPWVRKFPTSVIKAWFWKDVIIEPH
ncbi:MAG: ABC transporter substrate-binding protein [Anaerolineae bacterium]